MIIKILPVKKKLQIDRLIAYISNDEIEMNNPDTKSIFHNLQSTNLESIAQEFMENFENYRNTRIKNLGVHVILSICPLDRDKVTLDLMDDLAFTYLEKAYPNALAFGGHHFSKDHKHSHFLVSSNELMSTKATSLRKHQLYEIQEQMLTYMHEKYPELSTNIDLQKWGKKLHTEREYYQEKRHSDISTTRQELTEAIKNIFRVSESSSNFYHKLKEAGYETYTHQDQVFGVYWGDERKKMRFSRLELEPEMIDSLDRQNSRLKELESIHSMNKRRSLEQDREEERKF